MTRSRKILSMADRKREDVLSEATRLLRATPLQVLKDYLPTLREFTDPALIEPEPELRVVPWRRGA